MCNSNKRTGGMESSVVLFKPRIHLFACNHPPVSNTLDYNDWLAYKHQSTALCSNTFGVWFRVVYKQQSPPMPRLWVLVAHTHKYPALCSKHVWIMVRVGVQTSVYSPSIKHIWIVVPCCIKHRFKHVWIEDLCLRTRIVSISVFQTFGLWFRVSVQASVSGPL